jgi:hypothetical protein
MYSGTDFQKKIPRLKYQRQELESYWNRNYKDFFDSACTAKDTKVPGHARVVSICLMPLPTLSRARAVTRTRSLIRHTSSAILFALKYAVWIRTNG